MRRDGGNQRHLVHKGPTRASDLAPRGGAVCGGTYPRRTFVPNFVPISADPHGPGRTGAKVKLRSRTVLDLSWRNFKTGQVV
jgi:hypothetical protein